MTSYMLVRGCTCLEFEKTVETLLADGWKLQGGVCINAVADSDFVYLLQAMTKETT